jgi:GT2 family glycosyltransferase
LQKARLTACMTISVIIPTFQRPEALASCLCGLERQTRRADQIIIVVRQGDAPTFDLLGVKFPGISVVTVAVPGAVAAYNAGMAAATGDILAITDDDAVPRSDWLSRLGAHFSRDEKIGGVGGRDRVHTPGGVLQACKATVGIVRWYGRVVGNHHIGVGTPRPVDVLKGVNMSFRRAAISGIRCDQRMRGSGAQVHFELAFCLSLRRAGWTLVYDPELVVEHHPAPRFDVDTRNSSAFVPLRDISHNETLALLDYFSGVQRFIFLLWAFLVGTRLAPGLLIGPLAVLQRGRAGFVYIKAAFSGRREGLRTHRQAQNVTDPNLEAPQGSLTKP